MKKTFIKSFALSMVGALCMAGSVSATQIEGALSFAGGPFTAYLGSQSTSDLSNVTSIDFQDNTFFITQKLGDFSTINPTSTTTIQDFSISPFPAAGYSSFWTILDSVNQKTYSFELTTLSVFGQPSANFLSLSGTGTLFATGYDPTPGEWNFSAQKAGTGALTSYSWSSSNATVPEPSAMLIFGTGLFGLAGIGVRKRKNQA